MVVCDAVHADSATKKTTILGTFSSVFAKEFPATHPLMCLYVCVTNGRGDVPIRVQLIDPDDDKVLWSEERNAPFKDPCTVVEMGFAIPAVTFDAPGEYRFQLYASNEFLMERRILVQQEDPVSECNEQ